MRITTDKSRPLTMLRRVLGLDSVVTTANGLIYLVAAGPVGRLLEIPSALLAGLGIFLVSYGVAVGYLATRPAPSTASVRTVIVLNAGWVLASLAALLFGWVEPSTVGLVWIPLQAAVVATFAVAQGLLLQRWRGLR